MPGVVIQNMEMPDDCFRCPINTQYGMCGITNKFTPVQERPSWCPLKEYETTDRITLRGAIESPPVWGVIAVTDPERPINVKMTYADLYALSRMIEERGSADAK